MRTRIVKRINITPIPQQNEECGPACLTAVLAYFKNPLPMEHIIATIPPDIPKWRDWLYWLGSIAIQQGCATRIITLSTQTFDITWQGLSSQKLIKKLQNELRFVEKVLHKKREPYRFYFAEHHPKVEREEIKAAIHFLQCGGTIDIQPTTQDLLERELSRSNPIIVSVDATILYRTSRGIPKSNDVCGTTWGHVVIVNGFDKKNFFIVDPATWYKKNQRFKVPKAYVIESILRRDQSILIIKKRP